VVKDIRNIQPRRADKFCLLDVGTGSGCIPIAIKKQLPAHLITAVDISEQALEVARRNAGEQQVQVTFIHMNFLQPKEREALEQFDVITSNPPYIKKSEAATMANNVVQYEPGIALYVPDEDPLVFYKALAHFAQDHLAPKGCLYLEINEALGNEVVELLYNFGFREVELRKDLQGKDRMVRGKF
jgi:release factor glutamine methyltransferase